MQFRLIQILELGENMNKKLKKYLNYGNMAVILLLAAGILFSKVVPSTIKPWLLGLIALIEGIRFSLRFITKKSFRSETKLVFSILILFVFFAFMFFEIRFRNLLNNINQDFDSYDVHFVSTENTINESALELDGQTIGLLNDADSLVSHQLPKEIIDENELKVDWAYYESYADMIFALNDNEIDLVVLPGGYKESFGSIEGLTDIVANFHTVYSEIRTRESEVIETNQDVLNLVLIGGDNPIQGQSTAGFNYDVIVVLSMNLESGESRMLSIPRDSYIKLSCTNKNDKITHTGWFGAKCLTDTLSNFLDIEINKYALVDFKGLIEIVDSLGGIWIDVESRIVEQDENRNFDNLITIEPGYQKLDGQQALAFLRHRKTLAGGAITRSENHEKFIVALMKQLAQPSSLLNINGFIGGIENTVLTNLSNDDMMHYYDAGVKLIGKNGIDGILPESLQLEGYGDSIYSESFGSNLYYYVLNEESVQQIKTSFGEIQ